MFVINLGCPLVFSMEEDSQGGKSTTTLEDQVNVHKLTFTNIYPYLNSNGKHQIAQVYQITSRGENIKSYVLKP